MEVERHSELLGTFEDRPKELVVEMTAANVSIDRRPIELSTDAALKLLGGSARIGRRNAWKAGETDGIPTHRLSDIVVGVACKRFGFVGLALLDNRGGER